MGAAVLFVLLDFAIDLRPPGIHSSYQFTLKPLEPDQPVILQQDNLAIVVIRRSAVTIEKLERAGEPLQDPESRDSRQPDFARNPLRSRLPEYYVAMALGTHLGCPIRIEDGRLAEICSEARYDFSGRALKASADFRNLTVPDYVFSNQFRTLTVKP